jgi:hypothetical protein
MKTLKFAMIAALIACTMVSLASTDGFKSKPKMIRVLNLTIEKAVQNPGLVVAMHQQIDKNELLGTLQHYYVTNVTYNGVTYRISGTLSQWLRFFGLTIEPPVNPRNKNAGTN